MHIPALNFPDSNLYFTMPVRMEEVAFHPSGPPENSLQHIVIQLLKIRLFKIGIFAA
jgi:hypothetical protein